MADPKNPNQIDSIAGGERSPLDRVKEANEQLARLPDAVPTKSTPITPASVTPATPQPQAPQRPTDQFQSVNILAKFVTIVERRLESIGLQVIRLPGRDRVVHDQRNVKEGHAHKGGAGADAAEGADASDKQSKRAGPQSGKESQVDHAGAKRPNFMAGFQGVVPPGQTVKGEAKQQVLSAFENTLVGRFEGAEEQAKELPEGQFNFLKKNAGEWTGFFEKFCRALGKDCRSGGASASRDLGRRGVGEAREGV